MKFRKKKSKITKRTSERCKRRDDANALLGQSVVRAHCNDVNRNPTENSARYVYDNSESSQVPRSAVHSKKLTFGVDETSSSPCEQRTDREEFEAIGGTQIQLAHRRRQQLPMPFSA